RNVKLPPLVCVSSVLKGRRFIFIELSPTFSLLYSSRDFDRHHRLDYLRASCDRNWLDQVCEMENAQQTCARAGSDGSRTPGKSPQSNESGACHGSAARVNAAISHKLTRLIDEAVMLSEAKHLWVTFVARTHSKFIRDSSPATAG